MQVCHKEDFAAAVLPIIETIGTVAMSGCAQKVSKPTCVQKETKLTCPQTALQNTCKTWKDLLKQESALNHKSQIQHGDVIKDRSPIVADSVLGAHEGLCCRVNPQNAGHNNPTWICCEVLQEALETTCPVS